MLDMKMRKKILSAAAAVIILSGCGVTGKQQNPEPKGNDLMSSLNLRTDAPALTFPVIIPIYGTDDETLSNTRNLIRHLHETAGVTDFAISFPLNPQGENPYEKVKVYAERFGRLKQYNDIPQIRIGVLMQQTIGHSAVWNKNPNRALPWQRTVTMENAPSIRFCPLDPDFREYIRIATAGIFAHKPDFTLWDDDLRLYIQKEVECFCPRHTQLFNEKYSTNYTPAELQQAVKNAPDGSQLLKQFAQLRKETLLDFVSMIRKELDKHSPDALGIFCSVATQILDMPDMARATAGKNPTAVRIGSGLYLEREVRTIVYRTVKTGMQVAALRDKLDIMLDESDTCPHNLFSKTAKTMNLHIIVGLLHGLDGGKLWIANTRFYAPDPIIKFPQTIGKYQGFYRELHRTLKGVKWQGAALSVPAPESDPHPEFPGSYTNVDNWISWLTGYFGLPHSYEKATEKGIHLISGDQVKFFSDEELKRFLADGCILDAAAARLLAERGFAKYTGVIPQVLTRKISAGEWIKGVDNFFISAFGKQQNELIPADKNNPPEYISEFRDIEFYQAGKTTFVCNGAAVFTNSLGGKVITVPFEISESRIGVVPERQIYMRKIFDIAGVLPAWCAEPFDTFFRFGTLADGKQDIAAVSNISYQPMDEVNIGVKKVPSKIEKLSPDGGWDVCKFTVSENIVTISDTLECADTGVYKFSY